MPRASAIITSAYPPSAGYSGYHRILTIHDISTSARFAHAVLAAEEADTDPLTDFPFGHSAAQGFNPANYFMPRNAWKNQTRVRAHNRGRIAVTDSACFHPNPNLTRSRLKNGSFQQMKIVRRRNFHRFVCVLHRMCLNRFLSPSIREYMERSFRASRRPLRCAPEIALPRDRPGLRLSDPAPFGPATFPLASANAASMISF